MIMYFWVTVIIIITSHEWLSCRYSFMKTRVNVSWTLALFFCLSSNHFFFTFCSLSFNIWHNFLAAFNSFGLIFFQSQSKSLLTTNFTTYFLTNFTTISANLSNISIRILLSWSIRIFIFSIQICDLRKSIWKDDCLYVFLYVKKKKKRKNHICIKKKF